MLFRRLFLRPAGYAYLLMRLIFISSGVFADTGKKPDPKVAKRGAKIYATYCQLCHGKRGEGESDIPSLLIRPGYFMAPALDDSQHAWHHTDEGLIKFILKGSPRTKRMAAFKGTLNVNQARDVVAYFKSLWGPRALECQGPKHMSCPR